MTLGGGSQLRLEGRRAGADKKHAGMSTPKGHPPVTGTSGPLGSAVRKQAAAGRRGLVRAQADTDALGGKPLPATSLIRTRSPSRSRTSTRPFTPPPHPEAPGPLRARRTSSRSTTRARYTSWTHSALRGRHDRADQFASLTPSSQSSSALRSGPARRGLSWCLRSKLAMYHESVRRVYAHRTLHGELTEYANSTPN